MPLGRLRSGSHLSRYGANYLLFFGVVNIVPLSASVYESDKIRVSFSGCVSYSGVTGIQYRVNGGSWTTITSHTEISSTLHDFGITAPTISDGNTVDWRYVTGSGSLTACVGGADIDSAELEAANYIGRTLLDRASSPLLTRGDSYLLTRA